MYESYLDSGLESSDWQPGEDDYREMHFAQVEAEVMQLARGEKEHLLEMLVKELQEPVADSGLAPW